jgi:Spy/CpxP family protein refolding chaperone
MRILAVILLAAVLAGGGTAAADGSGNVDRDLLLFPFHTGPPQMFAQIGGPGDLYFQGQGRRGEKGRMRQHRKHLEQLRLLKMLELLDLQEEQEVGFLTSYRAMRRDLRAVDEERAQFVDELSQGLSKDSLSEAAINALVERILQTDDKRRQVRDEFMQAARTTLTPQQFGRLVIFHERFERELLDQVRSLRKFRQEEQPDGPPSP